MNLNLITNKANDLFQSAPFLAHIETSEEHARALEYMEYLIEDGETNKHADFSR